MTRAWLTAAVRHGEGTNKVYRAYEILGGCWVVMFDPPELPSYPPAPAADHGPTFAPEQGHRKLQRNAVCPLITLEQLEEE